MATNKFEQSISQVFLHHMILLALSRVLHGILQVCHEAPSHPAAYQLRLRCNNNKKLFKKNNGRVGEGGKGAERAGRG